MWPQRVLTIQNPELWLGGGSEGGHRVSRRGQALFKRMAGL